MTKRIKGEDMAKINVNNTEFTIIQVNDEDYICITDLARYKNAAHTDDVIKNWLRNRNTIELLGIWECLHNPDFNPVIFDGFRKEAGLNNFVMTPKKWIESTNAIGIISKSGRYGGTYAHKDIALENLNAVFINEGLSQRERLIKLNQIAIQQMKVLQEVEGRKLLK